jgi:hypothetical protein
MQDPVWLTSITAVHRHDLLMILSFIENTVRIRQAYDATSVGVAGAR